MIGQSNGPKRILLLCPPCERFLSNKKEAGGFTLLEVLIAIVVFGIVMGTVLGAYSGILSHMEKAEGDTGFYEMGKNALDRMQRDLAGLYVDLPPFYKPPGFNDEPDVYQFLGRSDDIGGGDVGWLQFASLAHIPLSGGPQEGIARIVYYAQADETGGVVLRRADHLLPAAAFEPSAVDPVICRQVVAFRLHYFNDEGEARESWDSENTENGYATPRAVSIVLALGDAGRPVRLSTRIALPVSRAAVETR